MASLVGSLADNKAALGRRYAEWAVSAPTLESAVAAAAMAQDELGHARSTYPVLKALGADAGRRGRHGGGPPAGLLDEQLPDWTAFIAANLLVDGVLTTFVAACASSAMSRWPSGRARSCRRRARTACTARRGRGGCAATRPSATGRGPPARDLGARRPLDRPRRGPGFARRGRAGHDRAGLRPPSASECGGGSPSCSPPRGSGSS